MIWSWDTAKFLREYNHKNLNKIVDANYDSCTTCGKLLADAPDEEKWMNWDGHTLSCSNPACQEWLFGITITDLGEDS